MKFSLLLLACLPLAAPTAIAAAESGAFAGFEILGSGAFGTSHTTNGGAPVAGGSIVEDVRFGPMAGIGGHAGYRLDGPLSVFVSYQYVRGDIGWNASFPLFGVSSRYDGTATSNVLLANLAYELAVSDASAIKLSAGVGASLNTLSGIVETDVASGSFLADVADHSILRPAAQIGASIQHEIAEDFVVGLGASLAYAGGFETGATRSGNLGITDINPYRIDDVWRAGVTASLQFRF